MSAECVPNYVVSCNPPEKTPVSEVVVVRTDEPSHLATTGGELGGGLVVLGVVLFVLAGITEFGRRVKR